MNKSAAALIGAILASAPAAVSAAPIEGVIGSMALACMGDFSRGGSHQQFQGALTAQGFEQLARADAEQFLRSAGGRGGEAYFTRFADTGDSLIIAFDTSGVCTFSAPEAGRAATENFLLESYPDQIRSNLVQTRSEGGVVDATYALSVTGTRVFVRFLGPPGRGGAVVWVAPERQPPPTIAPGTAIPWPQ